MFELRQRVFEIDKRVFEPRRRVFKIVNFYPTGTLWWEQKLLRVYDKLSFLAIFA
ncbi:MAG: hypothetical protein NHB32_27860 [Fischerella sp. CENA71]|nr:hypothetical protein [Fischerella sp. CENA71]